MSGNADMARELLITKGITSAIIKIGRLPPTPDKVIAIVDAPGQAPNPAWLLDYPALQVLVRGGIDEYDVARQLGKDIKDILLGVYSYTATNGDRWNSVLMRGDLNYIGPDDNSRPMFSLNFGLIIEPAASALTNRKPLPL